MADAPFGDTEQASYHYQVREAQVPVPGAIMVPLDAIERDPAQPRRDWRHDDGYERLAELTRSIQEFGILQPLVVRRAGDHYVVIAGGRRLVAAKRAGLSHVPVIVRDEEGARVRVLQLVENVQRQQLTPLDEARAYQELMEIEGLTIGEIAARIHVSTQTVRDKLRLLRDQVLADAVERGQLSATAPRALSKRRASSTHAGTHAPPIQGNKGSWDQRRLARRLNAPPVSQPIVPIADHATIAPWLLAQLPAGLPVAPPQFYRPQRRRPAGGSTSTVRWRKLRTVPACAIYWWVYPTNSLRMCWSMRWPEAGAPPVCSIWSARSGRSSSERCRGRQVGGDVAPCLESRRHRGLTNQAIYRDARASRRDARQTAPVTPVTMADGTL